MAANEGVVHGEAKRDLRIVYSDHLLNQHVDIGVMDELGNTEWVRVDQDELIKELRFLGVI